MSAALSFEHSYQDPARLCPVPAGPALLDGTCWTVRLAQGDAVIEAPRELLRRVATACDGTRSLQQIVQETTPAGLRPKVRRLLNDLLGAGALVDAGLYTVAAQRFAWTPAPIGRPAEAAVWQQVPRRFGITPDGAAAQPGPAVSSPLDALLDQRRSVRTFNDQPVDEPSLRSYLWLLAGLTATTRERQGAVVARRTVPSGGAVHAMRVHVVLQRQVGPWGPGAYEVQFPAVRQLQLQPVSPNAAWLPRAVLHPAYLRFATGMVFLVADPRLAAIKYLGRGLQYLFIEAGAALQNAGLGAPALGMAMTAYGGYVETAVATGLQLALHDVVLASTIFGAVPTEQQLRQASAAPQVEFNWTDAPSPTYTLPFHVGRARTEWRNGVQLEAWGRAADPWLAYTKAAAEACERLAFRTPGAVQLGRFVDWSDALDPRSVVRYAPGQFHRPGIDIRPFDERAVCGWVLGESMRTGQPVKVLAEQVYAWAALKEAVPAALAHYVRASSSGCAAHTQAGPAREAAVLELVERDAFMRAWLLQQPGTAVSLRSLPGPLSARVKALQKAGCTVWLQRLPSPWATAAVAFAQHEARHFTVVGAAARLTLDAALDGAMEEMESLAFARLHDTAPARMQPRHVDSPHDHVLLYSTARHFRRADAVMQAPQAKTFAALARADAGDGRPALQRLLEAGRDVVMVDMTPEHSTIDQGRTAITVVRALVPGLLPISFGYGREPLGCLDRIHERGRFPHPFP
jgi:ribosomal protein S12 methylthiotransferase accessory factor